MPMSHLWLLLQSWEKMLLIVTLTCEGQCQVLGSISDSRASPLGLLFCLFQFIILFLDWNFVLLNIVWVHSSLGHSLIFIENFICFLVLRPSLQILWMLLCPGVAGWHCHCCPMICLHWTHIQSLLIFFFLSSWSTPAVQEESQMTLPILVLMCKRFCFCFSWAVMALRALTQKILVPW